MMLMMMVVGWDKKPDSTELGMPLGVQVQHICSTLVAMRVRCFADALHRTCSIDCQQSITAAGRLTAGCWLLAPAGGCCGCCCCFGLRKREAVEGEAGRQAGRRAGRRAAAQQL